MGSVLTTVGVARAALAALMGVVGGAVVEVGVTVGGAGGADISGSTTTTSESAVSVEIFVITFLEE